VPVLSSCYVTSVFFLIRRHFRIFSDATSLPFLSSTYVTSVSFLQLHLHNFRFFPPPTSLPYFFPTMSLPVPYISYNYVANVSCFHLRHFRIISTNTLFPILSSAYVTSVSFLLFPTTTSFPFLSSSYVTSVPYHFYCNTLPAKSLPFFPTSYNYVPCVTFVFILRLGHFRYLSSSYATVLIKLGSTGYSTDMKTALFICTFFVKNIDNILK
jgi:hypothetical protein